MLSTRGLLGGAAAMLTVSAVLIYLAGIVALAARMKVHGFWWGLVLSQLPREVLQEIAASSVLLPALAFAVVGYLLPRVVLPAHSRLRRGLGALFERAPRAAFVLLTAVLAVPGTIALIHAGTARARWVFVLAEIVLLPAAAFLATALRKLRRYREAQPGVWIAACTTAMMLAAVPGAVVWSASLPLYDARACGAGYELDAYFIGAASDWTYLAEPSYDPKTGRAIAPQLVMVPTSRVNAVTVTRGDTDCSPTEGLLGTTKATAS